MECLACISPCAFEGTGEKKEKEGQRQREKGNERDSVEIRREASQKKTQPHSWFGPHLLCLTHLHAHSENISNEGKHLHSPIQTQLKRLHQTWKLLISQVALIINSLRGHASCLWDLTGLPDSIALLLTGGRTRLGLAPMITRTPPPSLFNQSWRGCRADVSEGERVFVFWSPEETSHITVSQALVLFFTEMWDTELFS